MFQNGPIRKVITIKVIFEDFLIFPSCRPSWLDTLKTLEDLFKIAKVKSTKSTESYILKHLLGKEPLLEVNR
jgi:hypothetical protein